MADPTRFKLQRLETRVGTIALVTIDNGLDWRKPNTFGEDALLSLDETLGRLRTRDWRGLILTGKPYVFAAGADIDEFAGISADRAREGAVAGHELFRRLRDLPFLTLAAINGAALGAGIEIAMHCDYRTISSSVRHFACPEVLLGIVPGWGGTQRLPRVVGLGVAKGLLYSGRNVDADEALRIGLVNGVHDPVLNKAREIAQLLATKSPVALRVLKRLANRALGGDHAENLDAGADSFGELFSSEDAKEGLTAFVEKREPRFVGR